MNVKLETEEPLGDFIKVLNQFDEVLSDYDTAKLLDEMYGNYKNSKDNEYTDTNNTSGEECSLE